MMECTYGLLSLVDIAFDHDGGIFCERRVGRYERQDNTTWM